MTERTKLVILGAATSFLEVIAIINAINEKEARYEVVAILDDNDETHGKSIRGVPVIGPLTQVASYPDCQFVFGIGSMKTRMIRHKLVEKLNLDLSRFETIIHPNAIIDESATVGQGCIVHPGVFIGNDAVIDPFVTIAVHTAIAPYVHISAYAMITSLVAILNGARIGTSAYIGACSCVTEGVSVGRYSMVGAGSVVTRDLDEGCFFLGNPGRVINKIEIPKD